ncbi:MAG: DivIVA domain-containing protein [Acidimicrobiales bacterium]|nr:DivIVA domain-containing protein [Acidimicrobiales bacterium]
MLNDDVVEYLETVELKTKMRGYDQIEVDDIFDRVSEEIKVLRESLKNSEEKVRVAEEHLDSEIKRLTVREKEVETLINEAKDQALKIVDNSRLEAENLRTSTEKELYLLATEEREKLKNQLSAIETRQKEIKSNVDLFEDQFSAHRERILRALGDMQQAIKNLSLLPGGLDLGSEPVDISKDDQIPTI